FLRKGGWLCANKSCLTVQRHGPAEIIEANAVASCDPGGLTPDTIQLTKYVGLALHFVTSNHGFRRANEGPVARKVLHKGYARAKRVVRRTIARSNLLGLG